MHDGWEADGEMVRSAYALRAGDDDFRQAGILVRQVFSAKERDELVETVAGALSGVAGEVLDRAFWYWRNVDADVGARIERKVRSGAVQQGVEGMGESADESLQRAV